MKKLILDQVLRHETAGVTVLYAAITGSRLYDLAHKDSDWDVHFIYVHPIDWYLDIAVEEKCDYIIDIDKTRGFDLQGWNLRKALNLARKGNPTLYERFTAPSLYSDQSFVLDMLPLVNTANTRVRSFYHYFNYARKRFRVDESSFREMPTKFFLEVARTTLSAYWLMCNMDNLDKVLPYRFDELVDQPLPEWTTLTAPKVLHEFAEACRNGDKFLFHQAGIMDVSNMLTLMLGVMADYKPPTVSNVSKDVANAVFLKHLEPNVRGPFIRRIPNG